MNTRLNQPACVRNRVIADHIKRRINYIQLIEAGRQPVTASGLVEIGLALGIKGSDLMARAEEAAGNAIRLPKVSKT